MSALQLTSLAAIKRACVVDARLQIIESSLPHLQVAIDAGPRRIVRQQTNGVAVQGCHRQKTQGKPAEGFKFDPDTLGWVTWPKARDVDIHGDDTFALWYGEGRRITYRVLP